MVDIRTFGKDVSYVKIIVVFPEVIHFFYIYNHAIGSIVNPEDFLAEKAKRLLMILQSNVI